MTRKKNTTQNKTSKISPVALIEEKHEEKATSQETEKTKEHKKYLRRHMIFLSVMFLSFLAGIIVYISFMPGLRAESKLKLRSLIPRSFSEFRKMNIKEKVLILYDTLKLYKNEHGIVLLILLSIFYIFYQSFPLFLWWMTGTATVITILIGSMYNYMFSILYCSILSTVAPLISYVIFTYSGKPVIEHFFNKHLLKFETQIKKHVKTKFDLFVYLAILRLTPIFPNSLINVLTASLSLPVLPFCLATYFGLLPNTVILVSVGEAINRISSLNMNQQFYISLVLILLLLIFQRVINSKYNVESMNANANVSVSA